MRRPKRRRRSPRAGQVLAEFALALPILLLLTLGILQLSLLFVAKSVVNHAAYAAARAELVGEDPEEAAEIVCAPISGIAGDERLAAYFIPGRGNLPRSGLSREKTTVDVIHPAVRRSGVVRVDVTHDYELIFPVVAELFLTEGAEHGGRPHRRMIETCTFARRWE